MERAMAPGTMTADEFLEIPPSDETRGRQLVEGEVVVYEPTLPHNEPQLTIAVALRNWTAAGSGRGIAYLPADIRLNALNVYAPDVIWYSEPRKPDPRSPRPYPIPDIAAEVRSPSTWRFDIGAKKRNYEAHGLPELWLVDNAAQVVLVYRRSRPDAPAFDVELEPAAGDVLTSPQLEGFALDVAELFAD
ncbi:MAG: Uma2 family endonuclease [Thermoleophilaceae bacterium]